MTGRSIGTSCPGRFTKQRRPDRIDYAVPRGAVKVVVGKSTNARCLRAFDWNGLGHAEPRGAVKVVVRKSTNARVFFDW